MTMSNEFQRWVREEQAAATMEPEHVAYIQAKAMANFCLATGMAPSEYKQLTLTEVEAFVKEHNRMNREN